VRIGLLGSVLLVACGGAAPEVETRARPADAPAEAPAAEPATAPTPFTAAQIRDGCPTGRWSVYRYTTPEGVTRRRMTFVQTDANVAWFDVVALDEDDEPIGEIEGGDATWEELRQHAAYPVPATTISDATLETPAGTFETRLYTVVDEEAGTTTRAWFAPSLPGPPVRHRVERDGELVSDMILEAVHVPERR